MRVLVAYASKMGGTRGLAEMIGRELEANGLESRVIDARAVKTLAGFDAVIVGGALYALRWHKDARRFVRRHRRALIGVPTWFFSSGPLDESARETEIPPVRFVRNAVERIGARDHVTFGGRMPPDAKGFLSGSMARDNAGDWRDPDHVREWAKEVAEQLHAA